MHTHFIAVHVIELCEYCGFVFSYKWEVCGNPASGKPTSAIFPIGSDDA